MGVRTLLLLAYASAICAYALAAGNGNGNGAYNIGNTNGAGNGNYNLGGGNGNGNGNLNTGSLNGNGNGNLNTGNINGNGNGNGNLGGFNGNGNGNNNLGNLNGNGNGNGNTGSHNGNGNGNGNIGSGNGNGNGNGNANGKGDPIMTGFGGRAFEFLGQPGSVYSLLSEKSHKINTALKLGMMWDHNGTYMEGFGFQYRDQQIQVTLNTEDRMSVTMNGEPLAMTKGETELELIPFVEGGELTVLWQAHRKDLGEAIEISTNMLQLLVWVTPAGTVDEGGVEQPAYLNFDIALLGPPSGNQMEGIVGETYNRMLVGAAANDPKSQYFLPDDYTFHGKGSAETYLVDGYFAETGNTMFGKDHKRVLIEEEQGAELQFPLRALGRAAGLSIASQPVTLRANGGRKGRFL